MHGIVYGRTTNTSFNGYPIRDFDTHVSWHPRIYAAWHSGHGDLECNQHGSPYSDSSIVFMVGATGKYSLIPARKRSLYCSGGITARSCGLCTTLFRFHSNDSCMMHTIIDSVTKVHEPQGVVLQGAYHKLVGAVVVYYAHNKLARRLVWTRNVSKVSFR